MRKVISNRVLRSELYTFLPSKLVSCSLSLIHWVSCRKCCRNSWHITNSVSDNLASLWCHNQSVNQIINHINTKLLNIKKKIVEEYLEGEKRYSRKKQSWRGVTNHGPFILASIIAKNNNKSHTVCSTSVEDSLLHKPEVGPIHNHLCATLNILSYLLLHLSCT